MAKDAEYRFKKTLFTPENPRPGEEGYLEPGFHFDEEGKIVDDKGNVYDQAYNLVRAAPSEGMRIAREQHPTRSDSQLAQLARIYQSKIDKRRANNPGQNRTKGKEQ